MGRRPICPIESRLGRPAPDRIPPRAPRDLSPEDLDAVVVTHEHSDHIRGVGILSRRYKLPVYINPKTQEAFASPTRQEIMEHFGVIGPA